MKSIKYSSVLINVIKKDTVDNSKLKILKKKWK